MSTNPSSEPWQRTYDRTSQELSFGIANGGSVAARARKSLTTSVQRSVMLTRQAERTSAYIGSLQIARTDNRTLAIGV